MTHKHFVSVFGRETIVLYKCRTEIEKNVYLINKEYFEVTLTFSESNLLGQEYCMMGTADNVKSSL